MDDFSKGKAELIAELRAMRERISELESRCGERCSAETPMDLDGRCATVEPNGPAARQVRRTPENFVGQADGPGRLSQGGSLHSWELCRLLTKNTATGIYIQRGGLLCYVNDRLASYLGFSAQEMIGKPFWQFVSEEDRPLVSDEVPQAPHAASPNPMGVLRAITKDGRRIWFRIATASVDYCGRPAKLGNVADVTETVYAEEDLRKAQQRLEELVEKRTAELVTTNRALRREIIDRRQAQTNLANELKKFRALYDVAMSMSAQLSMDENLNLLVEKSRRIVGADTAYVALKDRDKQEIYMRALSGVVTERFRNLRMPVGVGLGGMVAETRKGRIVEDYFAEVGPELHHVVAGEGLVSGIAVPIQMGQENLGVLYVFNRKRTVFSTAELDTLSLLGNLAALEITRDRTQEDLLQARLELERRVERRTADLKEANDNLLSEIGGRKKAQEALAQSERMLHQILSASPLGIGFVRSGTLEWTNQAMADMFGSQDSESYLGRKVKDFYASEEEYNRVADYTATKLKAGQNAELEVWLRRHDGSTFLGEMRTSAIDLKDPSKGLISTIWDISEKRRAEDELRESEARYRTLVEESFDGIFAQERTKIVFANSRLHALLGYENGELLGMDHWEVYHGPDREMTRRNAQARLRGEYAPTQYQVKLQRKDGTVLDGEINARVIMFRNKPGIQVWVKDITERKRSEQALKESEEKYRTIIENIEDVYYEVDLKGTFTFLNDAAQKTLGYSKEMVIGQNFRAFMTPSEAKKTRDMFDKVRETCEPVKAFELPFLKRDRSLKTLEVSISLVRDAQGEPVGFRGICRDTTERKRAQDELFKFAKLESIGVLAGGIAHDFNNILTAIQANISFARMFLDPSHKAYHRLLESEKAGERARGLTQQLLTFSRGGAPIKMATSVAEIVTDSCQFAVRGSTVSCEFDIPEGIPAVEVDPVQINQVIGNLIINAVQSMSVGGRIRVSAKLIESADDSEAPLDRGTYVRLSIQDEGLGIAEDALPKVFDPYFTTKSEGSGLGLATAYSIAKNHGGAITVESELGVGSIFHLYLPASDAVAEARPASVEEVLTGVGRVLLMDDEKAIRDMAAELLGLIGYEVETASDGEEAVEIFRKATKVGKSFDLVILDLTVPGGMGGKEAMELLRAVNPRVKAIVSSGYSNDPVMAKYARYGFSGVIPKPYDARTLSEAVHRAIGNHE